MVDKRLIHTISSMADGIVDKCAEILDSDEADNVDNPVLFDDIKEEIAELVEVTK